jgi:predicted DNA-binding protein YlxM (UPF0122 family)
MPFLPLLSSVSKLVKRVPTIVIDTREQQPLLFTDLPARVDTLRTGDYSLDGATEQFAVERKSLEDLIGCCVGENRERFERELHRLRGYRFRRLLVVSTEAEIERGKYRSQIAPKAILHTLRAFEVRYDVPVVFVETPTEAARRVESWVWWYACEICHAVNGLARELPEMREGRRKLNESLDKNRFRMDDVLRGWDTAPKQERAEDVNRRSV